MRLIAVVFLLLGLNALLFAETIMKNPLGVQPRTSVTNTTSTKRQQPQRITLAFLRSKPKGVVRDFYIWMFLDQDISPKEAAEARKLVYRRNDQLSNKLYRKENPHVVNSSVLGRSTVCQRMSFEELLKQDAQCIGYALKISDASKLPKGEIRKLSHKLKNVQPKLSKQLALISSHNVLDELVKSGAGTFAEIFNAVDLSYRQKELNRQIAPEKLKKLANQNNSAFTRLLRIIIMNPHYTQLHASLAKTDGIVAPNAMTLFYLGLNALKHDQKKRAIVYLKRAATKLEDPLMRDRIDFWLYKITGDRSYLAKLARSSYPSIHAIYATQKLNVAPSYKIVYDVLDYSISSQTRFDITDPFAWLHMQEKIKSGKKNLDLALRELYNQKTEPHYALALRRSTDFKNHYYIRPYREYFSRYSKDKQILFYAIGMQESFFIPASVSIAYALGMMQIMPFNVERIAKKLNEERHLTDMFHPEINLRYAAFLLEDLEREFKEPLFIAYAYNGGAGFVRRMLKRKDIFSRSNPLDPWLSLELVPYQESRYYGQRVLANYVIYQKAFGRDVRIDDLLQRTLINP